MTTVLRATDADVGCTASVPDPLPDLPSEGCPGSSRWLYLPGQYALARLHALVAEGFAVNRHVDYARNFGALEPVVRFSRSVAGEEQLVLAVAGAASVTVDGAPAAVLDEAGAHDETARAHDRPPALHDGARAAAPTTLVVHLPAGAARLTVEVTAPPDEPATLCEPDLPTASPWEVAVAGAQAEPAEVRLGCAELPPHRDDEPVVLLDVVRDGDLWVLPVPVLGRPVIRSADRPDVVTGESAAEAQAAERDQESRHVVVRRPDGAWTTVHRHGFRWLRVTGDGVESVQAEAAAHPVPHRGSFRCSDPVLTDVWSVAAFTLRTCMHGLMVDGIKRDRMPWIGDQALTTPANAYAFADGDVVRDGLDALGRVRDGYVNGIADYSLWWLVTLGTYARYFDAREFLAREGGRIDAFVGRLAAEADERGVLRPAPGDGPIDTVFIDWDAAIEQHRDSTALQLLWYWALRTAARLLAPLPGHQAGAARWDRLATTVLRTLRATAWDGRTQTWRTYLDGDEASVSPYPQLLAVLADVDPVVPAGVEQALLRPDAVGTPFMGTFALLALARAGHPDEAVRRVRARWGAMLRAGARTFWEQHGGEDDDPLAMYGRPFGRSLCHAWSAGPAALLPQVVCGIRPVADAWERLVVEPQLGELSWAEAVVPVPRGRLTVRVTPDEVAVEVPAGTTLVHPDHEHPGPAVVRWSPAVGCRGA